MAPSLCSLLSSAYCQAAVLFSFLDFVFLFSLLFVCSCFARILTLPLNVVFPLLNSPMNSLYPSLLSPSEVVDVSVSSSSSSSLELPESTVSSLSSTSPSFGIVRCSLLIVLVPLLNFPVLSLLYWYSGHTTVGYLTVLLAFCRLISFGISSCGNMGDVALSCTSACSLVAKYWILSCG